MLLENQTGETMRTKHININFDNRAYNIIVIAILAVCMVAVGAPWWGILILAIALIG